MNKTIIALSLLTCSAHAAAQNIGMYTPGSDEGIVYFLPKTALEVNIVATHVSYQPGDLCQYANRYLRINDVNPQPDTHWEIKRIDVRSAGVPDSTKVYITKLKDKSVLSNVELTENGIVKAINTTSTDNTTATGYELEKPQPHENARKYMTEEILMAGSTAKMAELTAKEIYNIRESKNLILRGQADTMPKDGASLKLVIDNLDKQEKALLQLFTGTTDREDKVFTVRIEPEDNMKDKIVLRFSRLLGALSTDNLAGDPIYLNINSSAPIPTIPEDGKKGKKLEGAIYNIPGKGKVSISYQGKTYFNDELPITQFGSTEVLVEELFNKKVNTRVVFNPETGAIVKIDKD